MQTIIHRMGKKQGPTVQHRESIQYPVINHNRKEYVKEYICITESLCCTAKTNTHCKSTILQQNNFFQNQFFSNNFS